MRPNRRDGRESEREGGREGETDKANAERASAEAEAEEDQYNTDPKNKTVPAVRRRGTSAAPLVIVITV